MKNYQMIWSPRPCSVVAIGGLYYEPGVVTVRDDLFGGSLHFWYMIIMAVVEAVDLFGLFPALLALVVAPLLQSAAWASPQRD